MRKVRYRTFNFHKLKLNDPQLDGLEKCLEFASMLRYLSISHHAEFHVIIVLKNVQCCPASGLMQISESCLEKWESIDVVLSLNNTVAFGDLKDSSFQLLKIL